MPAQACELLLLALGIPAEHRCWINRPVVAVQGPIQHQLLSWKTAVTQQLRQGKPIVAALKTATEWLERLIWWSPRALPLPMDHPGGGLDRFPLKKGVLQSLCERSAGLTPLLFGFPSQAMGDVGQDQAVSELAAINEHVKADADWFAITLQNGLAELITTALDAQHLNA